MGAARIAEPSALEDFADITDELAARTLPGYRMEGIDEGLVAAFHDGSSGGWRLSVLGYRMSALTPDPPAAPATSTGDPKSASGVPRPTAGLAGPSATVDGVRRSDCARRPRSRRVAGPAARDRSNFSCAVPVDNIGEHTDESAPLLQLPAGSSLERRPPPECPPDELLLDEIAVTLARETLCPPSVSIPLLCASERLGDHSQDARLGRLPGALSARLPTPALAANAEVPRVPAGTPGA